MKKTKKIIFGTFLLGAFLSLGLVSNSIACGGGEDDCEMCGSGNSDCTVTCDGRTISCDGKGITVDQDAPDDGR